MFKKRRSAVNTIILDRTSALTNNQLVVTSVWQPRLATSKIATTLTQATLVSTDPLDRALIEYTASHGGIQSPHQALRQFHFSQQQGLSGNLWHHGANYILAVKGMPEQVINQCDLSDNERESILLQLQTQSVSGGYVVALAQATLQRPIRQLSDLAAKHRLEFVGFINLTVTIPSSTKQLINIARTRGIKTYLLTGQHTSAGYHLASQIGIASHPRDVLDANKLELLSDDQIHQALSDTSVIARASSAQKRHIIQLLQTGDNHVRHINTIDELRQLIT